jgi:hypothetical protein|mmetsp:Transcript_4805/g.16041  ORF Transcript_4805/g.16041 Transcript_4805/m.16041 type:complete len:98 (+) Transcript_4805:1581-1874(+)
MAIVIINNNIIDADLVMTDLVETSAAALVETASTEEEINLQHANMDSRLTLRHARSSYSVLVTRAHSWRVVNDAFSLSSWSSHDRARSRPQPTRSTA